MIRGNKASKKGLLLLTAGQVNLAFAKQPP
jgi:hypothetical protein